MATPHITLKNGDIVRVNDHVYCSPTWAARDGTPYSVARIMEFLPPEGTARGAPVASAKGKNKLEVPRYTRARLAWYYRPSDVSDRTIADNRLLLAAIYSEICDVAQLREKCYVCHRDKISNLADWKKRDDHFYFLKLFDPYIKKEFEIIRSSTVKNIPDHIREVLTSRYEYVVAEKEVVPDLTDTLRTCATCTEWCPPPETVRCDRCERFFHMACVQPPLIAKPSRGYGWTCAPCSRAHEKAVEGHAVAVRHTTPVTKPKSNAPARPRGRPRKDRSLAEREETMAIRHFNLWPFRYFGLYTVAEDTLDPDDLIFPRTTTRVGPKYQVVIPPMDSARDPGLEERGEPATMEVLSVVDAMGAEDVERRMDALASREDVRTSVDWLTEVVYRLSQAWSAGVPFSSVTMDNPYRMAKWKAGQVKYTDREWDEDEKAAFEDGIFVHGAELRAVREEVATRDIYEVVRYYGHWKNEKLGEENELRRRKGAAYKPEGTPNIVDSDEEGSLYRGSKTNISCGCCHSTATKDWYKAPKNTTYGILCYKCGMHYRKYAEFTNPRTSREDTTAVKTKAVEKREGTPLASVAKRAKTSSSVRSTPPPAGQSGNQIRCLACHKNGPPSKVLKCQRCSTRMHADPSTVESWTCDLCENEQLPEASLNTDCVLCPRPKRDKKTNSTKDKDKDRAPLADSYLRVCKPTEGQSWAHVVCSVFMPEVTFSDASRLRLVEGISSIPLHRWTSKCVLCGQQGGAVVRCSECVDEYHVSCAWSRGFKFGFEIAPVKGSKRSENTTLVNFKDVMGSMTAIVRCKEHDSGRRPFYDICETNEFGETALQVYCRTHKQAQVAQSHALLRKARRLDQILGNTGNGTAENGHASSSTSTAGNVHGHAGTAAEPQCVKCNTVYSPFFHTVTEPHHGPQQIPLPMVMPMTGMTNGASTSTNGASSSSSMMTNGNGRTTPTPIAAAS
ncbi:hypothetical protein OF83DRAFT_1163302 [Amylostereum chailletii]|nr:hypothetical protein OF83DRAFT_1163302 [Amylostereum chailletii]